MNKDKILLIVFALLLASSGLVLYRGFSSESLSVISEPTGDGSSDVVARSQADAVKGKITKAIGKIDTGGPLDSLMESQQFKDLFIVDGQESSGPSILASTTIGAYGRPNPFLPYATSTTE